METSIFLAQAMGIYFFVMGVALLLRRDELLALSKELFKNGPALFVMKTVGLVVGILLVLSHSIWEPDFRFLVSLIAWIAFLKYAVFMLWPKKMLEMAEHWMTPVWMTAGNWIAVVLGLYLSYVGFFA